MPRHLTTEGTSSLSCNPGGCDRIVQSQTGGSSARYLHPTLPDGQGLEKTREERRMDSRGTQEGEMQGRIQDLFLQQKQPSWGSW